MDKKLKATVENVHGVIAVYNYQISSDSSASVLIVESFTKKMAWALKDCFKKKEQLIVLTRNDLEFGYDVYSIPLLHIQVRWTCIRWDDVLSNLKISTNLRPYLEGMIRHVLIDLREALIRWAKRRDVKQWLRGQYDRILCWCATYLWSNIYQQESMELLIDEKRWTQAWVLWALLSTENKKDKDWMRTAHDLLLELVEKVDWLD